MLEQFNIQTDAYCATLQQNLQSLLRSNSVFNEAFTDKMVELELLNSQKQEAHDQLQTLVLSRKEKESALSQEIIDFGQKINILKTQIVQIKSEIDTKRVALRQNQAKVSAPQNLSKELLQRYKMYKTMLKMDIEMIDDCFKITFYGIGKAQKFAEFHVGDTLELKAISDSLVGLDDFLDEFDLTGNLGLLIRRIRRGFVQQEKGK
ncbi:hypothetical protein SS50377_20616 [Spironucleus salmonicida]|uniref:Kinetochore protein SPC25 n=1 Tax=Spironucleus salmonicida TaxID=348837 RepID=V6LNR4_9EUKA|nr:hypothetical protein SS50377_20616 [Spironucleus salmonicida]|eukprot:EST45883.1 hypothetical protein SS50377_14174 [Spironucleus salmonicida]